MTHAIDPVIDPAADPGAPSWTTAEQLLSMAAHDDRRELVNGELRIMSPAGGQHGRIAGKLFLRIGNHVERHRLGAAYAAETGFLLTRNPDTVRAPDVSYVCQAKLGELADYPGFLPLAPDLAAEVVSPHDEAHDIEKKAIAWLQAGVRVVLVVNPKTHSISVYRQCNVDVPDRAQAGPVQAGPMQAGPMQIVSQGSVDLTDVLPGFQLNVDELFA